MKDAVLLLLAAACVGGAAWLFWHFFGKDGFGILSAIALVALTVDNIRLRRQLRDR